MGKLIQLSCPTCGARLEMEGTEGPIFGTCTTCGNWYAYEQEHSYAAKNDIGYLMCGIDHLEMENWNYAKEEFEKYVKKHPKDYRGWLGLWLAGDADERTSGDFYRDIIDFGYKTNIFVPTKKVCTTRERILALASKDIKPKLGNLIWYSDGFERIGNEAIEKLREKVSALQKEKADIESHYQFCIEAENRNAAKRISEEEDKIQEYTKKTMISFIPICSVVFGGLFWLICGKFHVSIILVGCVMGAVASWFICQKTGFLQHNDANISQSKEIISKTRTDSLSVVERLKKDQELNISRNSKEIEEVSKTLAKAERVMEEYKHDVEGMVSDERLIALLKEEILLSAKSK